MNLDWKNIKANIIAGTIIIIVFGVSYLPIASLIVNGDLSWARDFWQGFGGTVDVIREINFFYVFLPTSVLSGLGWILSKIFPDNSLSKMITIFHPILAVSFLIFVFTGYQDASEIGLRP
mgnify:FL=1